MTAYVALLRGINVGRVDHQLDIRTPSGLRRRLDLLC
jgi:hypothetical protein